MTRAWGVLPELGSGANVLSAIATRALHVLQRLTPATLGAPPGGVARSAHRVPTHRRATEVDTPRGDAGEGQAAEAERRRLVQPETEHGRKESDDRREERVQDRGHGDLLGYLR